MQKFNVGKNTIIGFSSLFLLCNHGICADECSAKLEGEEAFLLSQDLTDNGLVEKFDDLESQLHNSDDPIRESRDFLSSYINQMNIQYGLSLTIEEACKIAKNNLDLMNFPPEVYAQAVMILDLLCANQENIQDNESIIHFEMISRKTSSPLDWKWLRRNKRHHKKNKTNEKHTMIAQSGTITEIPGVFPFVVGLVEGAIGLVVFPFNPVAGGLLIGDGCTRVIQGIQENMQGTLEKKPG